GAGARTENGITRLLKHGVTRTQIDLVVFYAENQGLARDCGRRSGHLQAKLLNRFRLPEQSTCRKYRKHCMASNESLSSKYVNSHRSEEHTSELQSLRHIVCRLL